MKPKNNHEIRLSLSKQTIAKLDKAKMELFLGGNDSKTILTIFYLCDTLNGACQAQQV
ncbi:class I lanthipeptide [Chitinophaga agrisoli]|uniref:class I lanthipeptide n=1 Tax=Chitinophaga agrisoli TaxID=2607653 RepID=UPI00166203EC|nr:class I lanthipeptide [Chitinophaga agrisoli]